MADQYYTVPKDPKYHDNNIRRIQNSDPVNADVIVTPVIEALMENTAAVKKEAEEGVKGANAMAQAAQQTANGAGEDAGIAQAAAGAAAAAAAAAQSAAAAASAEAKKAQTTADGAQTTATDANNLAVRLNNAIYAEKLVLGWNATATCSREDCHKTGGHCCHTTDRTFTKETEGVRLFEELEPGVLFEIDPDGEA